MRRLTTLLLAVSLVLAAACSGSDDDAADQQGSPAERVAAAADLTQEDGSARTSFEAAVTGLLRSDEPSSATGEGLVDFAQHRGSLEVDLGPLLAGAGIPGLDAQSETLFEGNVIYLRSSLLNSFLGVDTPWIRVDLEAPAGNTGLDLSPLATLTGNDPGAQLGLLAGVDPGSVRELGGQDVRGENTVRYGAAVDLVVAATQAGTDAERQRFERLRTQLGTDRLDIQVDLDRQGRVRRLAYAQPLPADAGGATSEVVLEYYDFGTDVDLTIPGPDQVTDVADVPIPGG